MREKAADGDHIRRDPAPVEGTHRELGARGEGREQEQERGLRRPQKGRDDPRGVAALAQMGIARGRDQVVRGEERHPEPRGLREAVPLGETRYVPARPKQPGDGRAPPEPQRTPLVVHDPAPADLFAAVGEEGQGHAREQPHRPQQKHGWHGQAGRHAAQQIDLIRTEDPSIDGRMERAIPLNPRHPQAEGEREQAEPPRDGRRDQEPPIVRQPQPHRRSDPRVPEPARWTDVHDRGGQRGHLREEDLRGVTEAAPAGDEPDDDLAADDPEQRIEERDAPHRTRRLGSGPEVMRGEAEEGTTHEARRSPSRPPTPQEGFAPGTL